MLTTTIIHTKKYKYIESSELGPYRAIVLPCLFPLWSPGEYSASNQMSFGEYATSGKMDLPDLRYGITSTGN